MIAILPVLYLFAVAWGIMFCRSVYTLMCDRYEQRRLERCGLDYYMPKHLLQKQLYALHGDPFRG